MFRTAEKQLKPWFKREKNGNAHHFAASETGDVATGALEALRMNAPYVRSVPHEDVDRKTSSTSQGPFDSLITVISLSNSGDELDGLERVLVSGVGW